MAHSVLLHVARSSVLAEQQDAVPEIDSSWLWIQLGALSSATSSALRVAWPSLASQHFMQCHREGIDSIPSCNDQMRFFWVKSFYVFWSLDTIYSTNPYMYIHEQHHWLYLSSYSISTYIQPFGRYQVSRFVGPKFLMPGNDPRHNIMPEDYTNTLGGDSGDPPFSKNQSLWGKWARWHMSKCTFAHCRFIWFRSPCD